MNFLAAAHRFRASGSRALSPADIRHDLAGLAGGAQLERWGAIEGVSPRRWAMCDDVPWDSGSPHAGGWFSGPMADAPLEHINTYVLFWLAKGLQTCFLLARGPIKSYITSVREADYILELLLNQPGGVQLNESAQAARHLLGLLRHTSELLAKDGEAVLEDGDLQALYHGVWVFDVAIALELNRAPIFYVTPKGVFDTSALIIGASAVYEGYKDRLPEKALADTDQAGRCLAFGLPTAAGFHIARATEAVILKLMDVFGCDPPKESQRGWGTYIDALEKKCADRRVTHSLRQIKALHRNPLMHPEVTLTLPEALSLWAICTSTIQAMVADMEKKSQQPSPEIVAMLPPPSDS
jgi:hypothetical protein